MSKQAFLIVGFVAGVVVGTIAGAHVAGKQNQVGVNASAQLSPAHNEGKIAPDFQLSSLDGKQVKLSSYRGKAVLLNFWATWCGPCKIEMPWFAELQKRYRDQGLEVVGISADNEDKNAVSQFARQMSVNYTILLGTDPVSDAYGGVQGLPTTFYIDREGKIVKQVMGLISEDEIEANVRASLQLPAEPTASASK